MGQINLSIDAVKVESNMRSSELSLSHTNLWMFIFEYENFDTVSYNTHTDQISSSFFLPNSLTPSLLSHHPFCSMHSYLSQYEGWKRYYYGVPGWREETGVATWIAWGERRANDGGTGLVSGLCYLLEVIDGECRGKRRRRRWCACTCILYYCFEKRTDIFTMECTVLTFINVFINNYIVSCEPQLTFT